MLASASQECESAVSIHTPLSLEPPTPSPTPSHPISELSQHTRLSFLCYTENFPLTILHMAIYMFQCYSFSSSHPLLP